MLDSGNTTVQGPVGLVNEFGRPFLERTEKLSPMDDPDVWLEAPMYSPPSGVDIVAEQKWIDSLMGTTRNGESIYKLVWNGDRRYWYEFYMQWFSTGLPSSPLTRRPRIRYKALRDDNTRALIRDVFPPRWLILTRIEPEQYAETWKQESWVYAPEIHCKKQIRPDDPPKVFWMWYATIAKHDDYCCATKAREYKKCFGSYRPPRYAGQLLAAQSKADRDSGMSPFSKVEPSWISEVEEEQNGYAQELADLQVEAEIFIENPMALLGIQASLKAGLDDPKKARQFVKDFYDRQIQEQSKLI